MVNAFGVVSLVLTILATVLVLCSASGAVSNNYDTQKDLNWMHIEVGPLGVYVGSVVVCTGVSSLNDCTWFADFNDAFPDEIKNSGNAVALFTWVTLVLLAVKIGMAASYLCAKPCCGCGCPASAVLGIVSAVLLLISVSVYAANIRENDDLKALTQGSNKEFDYGPGFSCAVTSLVLMVIDAPLAFMAHSASKAAAAQFGASGAQMTNVATAQPVTIATAK